MENHPVKNSPTATDRFLGVLAGASVGGILGIITNVVLYNVTNQAVNLGWANSIWGGAIFGAALGVAFPSVANGAAWMFSMFIPY
jgi:hypothetical protein